jgi:pyrroline-5-carboxylate reductase
LTAGCLQNFIARPKIIVCHRAASLYYLLFLLILLDDEVTKKAIILMNQPKHTLLVGTGNMAEPLYRTLAGALGEGQDRLTLCCGLSEGKNRQAVSEILQQDGLLKENIAILERNESLAIESLNPADLFVFCGKPFQLETIFEQYKHAITKDTTILTVAAGPCIEQYRKILAEKISPEVAEEASIVRIMPHLPRKFYAIYGEDKQKADALKPLLHPIGEPVDLKQEDDIHHFIGHAGSSPAFIAQFLHRTPQTDAKKELRDLASGMQQLPATPQPGDSSTVKFYRNWLHQAKEELGGERGAEIINQTILGTLDKLAREGLEPHDFAQKVRSKKGATSIGLLLMGDPVPNIADKPDKPGWGTKKEIDAQNEIATRCISGKSPFAESDAPIPLEESILCATRFCAARSKGMETHPNDPLYIDTDFTKGQTFREKNNGISQAG